MRIRRSGLLVGAAALAVMASSQAAFAASTTVVVRPATLQGWIVDTVVLGNSPVATTFAGPADADGGDGSFQFGPIGAPNASKQELQPPAINTPVADFGGFEYDYDVIAPVAGNPANHFYLNAYLDSSANGIGTFSNGFYDCRLSFVPSAAGAPWATLSVTPTTAASAQAGALCAGDEIGEAPAGSLIRFFRLNGGDTSASDNGLVGAYDLVDITIGGDTTTYDFEPNLSQPATKDDCKNGGWKDLGRPDNSTFKNQGDCIQWVNTGK
jgi:hypothetical protein